MGTLNLTYPLKILLAVDDSQYSTAAVNLLTRITWPVGTSVHVLAVVPERLPLMERNLEAQSEINETLEIIRWRDWAAAKIIITEAANQLKTHHLAVETEICEGPATRVLLERAGELSANLIVVGAKGLCPPGKFKLSPTAHKLAHYAPHSVLIVRPSDQVRPLNTILVVNETPEACQAVEFLCALSLPQWARVTVVNVARVKSAVLASVGGANYDYSLSEAGQTIIGAAEECITKAIEQLHNCGVQVRSTVRLGQPADEILSAAQEQAADLIVVGTREQTASVSGLVQKIIKYAPCSVLAVRKGIAEQLMPLDNYILAV